MSTSLLVRVLLADDHAVVRAGIRSAAADTLTALDYLKSDFDGGLALYSSDGNLHASTGQRIVSSNAELTRLLAHMSSEPVLSSPFIDPAGHNVFLLVGMSIDPTTIAVGALWATVKSGRNFSNILRSP